MKSTRQVLLALLILTDQNPKDLRFCLLTHPQVRINKPQKDVFMFSNWNSEGRPFNKWDLCLRYDKLGSLGLIMWLKEEAGSSDSGGHQRKRKRLSAFKHILKGEIKNKYTDTQTQPTLSKHLARQRIAKSWLPFL